MKTLTVLLLLGWLFIPARAISADGDNLAYPTEDAKAAYQAGNIEFVGIQLEQELLLPGLEPAQREIVLRKYQTRALNTRWKTFKNIEQQPKRLQRIKRYAIRYNLMMWKLSHSPQSDRFKYRY